ncbi:heavy metal translocating P-type ATPase [Helicobacter burdigaliensis]|uniref:heavy metal translocating P-type ATPase n=1 Tax=Helicobacter burdigaliensis TaxID=2315334 RepID=UPI000EF71323|nr:heavy metal translocating P-type ATPase [Helicobacter burdigaliensis]
MLKKCDHCHLEFDTSSLIKTQIKGEDRYFCCKGCEGVYKLLLDEGLEDFYAKLGKGTLSPVENHLNESLEYFDSEAFLEKYIQEKDGFCEVALILEKIHCVACVWLNEKILSKQVGIKKALINYTNHKATILFDKNKIKLSQIIAIIRMLGYDAHIYDSKLQEQYVKKEKRDYYIKMSVGIFCVMNIMWIAVAQYAGYFSGISQDMKNILNFAGFVLSTPVLFFSGSIFWRGAYTALKFKIPNMDLLVISGATLGYLYSIYASFYGGETYFESVAMIITFVLVGKFLEIRGKKSAVDSLDMLNATMPLSVVVCEGEKRIEKALEAVKIGDLVEVKVGERVALDGVLKSSEAVCDESALSGESLPVFKRYSNPILSGSLVLDRPFLYEVTKSFKDSLMSTLIHLVEESLNARPKIEEMANKISRYFSLVILSLAILTFFIWFLGAYAGFEKSLMVMISVIIIACPCALALATPIASLVGLNEAFKKKILFKEARLIESIAQANVLVLDKTGTLTKGKLKVVDKISKTEDFGILKQILSKSSHPIALAVLGYLEQSFKEVSQEKLEFSKLEQVSARGMSAKLGEDFYYGGNEAHLLENGIKIPKEIKEKFKERSIFCYAKNNELLAVFMLEDELKEDAKIALDSIKQMGISLVLLSGDNYGVCKKIAKELGISEYHANCSPISKAEFIDKLHKEGKKVIMAGDGINDALALSKSDVSIAMGGGIDVAISVSNVVVLDDRVEGVKEAIRLGKRTYGFIKQNLWISLVYNLLTIPLAMAGYVIPLVAALSMSLSSLLVVGNSMRIKQNSEE